MKTLSAALGTGLLLLSFATPALAEQARPLPQPTSAPKIQGEEREHDKRCEPRPKKHVAEHGSKHDQERRHGRD
jgi:hypothetical protein